MGSCLFAGLFLLAMLPPALGLYWFGFWGGALGVLVDVAVIMLFLWWISALKRP